MKRQVPSTQPLLPFLETLFPGASRRTLRHKLAQEHVLINGRVIVDAQYLLNEGDMVMVHPKKYVTGTRIPIFLEDRDVLVVEKPAGLLSVDTPKNTYSLHTLLKKHTKAPVVYPVHRLDKDTSGLIVFALSIKARDNLKGQIFRREVHREYHAIVQGTTLPDSGSIACNLEETKSLKMKVVSHGGKEALTHYTVKKRFRKTTLVACTLHTGKKHQIRVSFAHEGAPVVGDETYGAPKGAKRMMLHAFRLSFKHPDTGQGCSFTSETPFL